MKDRKNLKDWPYELYAHDPDCAGDGERGRIRYWREDSFHVDDSTTFRCPLWREKAPLESYDPHFLCEPRKVL